MSEEIKQKNVVTPVVFNKQVRKWQSVLFFLAAGIVVIAAIYMQHHSSVTELPEVQANTQSVNYSPPKLSTVEQQLEEIKLSTEKQQVEADAHDQEREEAAKLQKMRMVAPTTVYSANGAQTGNQTAGSQNSVGVLGGNGAGDDNTQFMSRVSASSVDTVNATRIAHPSMTLAQGTMIWATLESRIASELPGMIRAVTSEDIYSEDGSLVMLPKGSRLIGQYTNAIAQGQQRIFVVWQRVIRPDHIDIQLNSPGTDALGTAGVGADAIDRHFMEQFGTSALLSMISAGAANIGVSSQDQFNSASAYREAISNSFAQTAQNTLQSKGVINPTLYIDQGRPISVFVARDLDFYNQLSGK